MNNKKAFSIIEYAILLAIILTAFGIMQPHIQRGLYGLWQSAGKSFGYGRQYDSAKTVECAFDEQINQWYDRRCFEQAVSGRVPPCNSGDTTCEAPAMQGCVTTACAQASTNMNGA